MEEKAVPQETEREAPQVEEGKEVQREVEWVEQAVEGVEQAEVDPMKRDRVEGLEIASSFQSIAGGGRSWVWYLSPLAEDQGYHL